MKGDKWRITKKTLAINNIIYSFGNHSSVAMNINSHLTLKLETLLGVSIARSDSDYNMLSIKTVCAIIKNNNKLTRG